MIQSDPPDLVLCEWHMPRLDGVELLRALRATGNQVLFGFVTMEGGAAMRSTAAEAGADFLIAKPVTAEVLAQVLHDVLGGHRPQP